MDAVSVVGTALSIAGAAQDAASQSLKFFRRLRKAPQDIKALQREVFNLELVLRHVVLAYQDMGHPQALDVLLEDARTQLMNLNNLMYQELFKTAQGTEVDRLRWATHKEHTEKLRIQLRSTRDDIALLLTADTSYVYCFLLPQYNSYNGDIAPI